MRKAAVLKTAVGCEQRPLGVRVLPPPYEEKRMATTLEQKLSRLEFVQRLRQQMDKQHLSIKDISKIAGCSSRTVSRWLNGENAPHVAMQRALLRELEK